MTMGTASTMASMVEALGVSLPGNAAIPAVDSQRYRLAQLSGRRIVEMVHEDLVLSKILTRKAFENAIMANAAIGGSTNSVVHLLAIAGRTGRETRARGLGSTRVTASVPGEPAAVGQVPDGRLLLRGRSARGAARDRAGAQQGRAHRQRPDHGREHRERAVLESRRHQGIRRSVQGQRGHCHPARQPRAQRRGHQALGRDAQTTQASRQGGGVRDHRRLQGAHRSTRISRSTRTRIMVLKGCGPKGYPGMAEVGNMPLPPKILRKGITDMVRISDARMSGTAYGTVVLHVAPEAAAGGPLALVRTGDVIELDVPARKLHLDVSDAELATPQGRMGGARSAEARLLQAVRRARAAGRQGRGPGFPGRRQRHHGHAATRTERGSVKGLEIAAAARPIEVFRIERDRHARGATDDVPPRYESEVARVRAVVAVVAQHEVVSGGTRTGAKNSRGPRRPRACATCRAPEARRIHARHPAAVPACRPAMWTGAGDRPARSPRTRR